VNSLIGQQTLQIDFSASWILVVLALPRGELKRIEVEIPRTSKDFGGNEVSRS
jgi:hypothetical protein